MKKTEIIELNGKEYTVELNRDSFLQIDKICNIQKSMEIINSGLYDYVEEIDDNYNPLENGISDEQLEEKVSLKEKTLYGLIEKSLFILLYPHHKLTISEVKELVKPYLEDETKAEWLGQKVGDFIQKCVEIRQDYVKERKNLEAQTNKK